MKKLVVILCSIIAAASVMVGVVAINTVASSPAMDESKEAEVSQIKEEIENKTRIEQESIMSDLIESGKYDELYDEESVSEEIKEARKGSQARIDANKTQAYQQADTILKILQKAGYYKDGLNIEQLYNDDVYLDFVANCCNVYNDASLNLTTEELAQLNLIIEQSYHKMAGLKSEKVSATKELILKTITPRYSSNK